MRNRSTPSPPRSSGWPCCTRFLPAIHAAGAAASDSSTPRRRSPADGLPPNMSRTELLHFLGEIEVVFGLWAVVLAIAIAGYAGWGAARHYLNDTVNYTEPLFVVVIMALASTRPIVAFAEARCGRVAAAGGGTPAAWWVAILIVGPLLGSFITEPAAMTICALLLARQFYDLQPGLRLKYATLGLLFVNVSIGGTLTPFRRAAGADGRATMGMGYDVHARARRLAGGASRSPCRRWSTLSDVPPRAARAWPRGARVATSSRRTTTPRRRAAADSRMGDRRARRRSWSGRSSTRTTRRCSSAGSCSSSGSRAPRRAYQSRLDLRDAAAGRVLSRRPRHSRRPAGLVDCAGARATVTQRRCLSARRC